MISQLISICVSLAAMLTGSTGAAICTNPHPSVLHQQWINIHFGSPDVQHESHFIQPLYRNLKRDMLSLSSRQYASHVPFTSNSDKEKRCPLEPSHGMNDELALRSTCPWYYVTNHDQNRYPRDMMEVECACRDACSGVTTTSGLAHCEKSFYNVPVLRRSTCNETTGQYTWEEGWQRLANACVCARRPEANA